MVFPVPRMDQHCLPSPDIPTWQIKNPEHSDNWMITKFLPVHQQWKYWKESTARPGTRQRYTKGSIYGHRRSTYGRTVKTERFLTRKHTGTEEDEDGHAFNRWEFPFDEPFINSGNITIITVLKKVKQVRISATYEHAGKNTKYPFCS
jgi:hypothetical protein